MALTKTQVSELYVAIFNRASEGEGNSFWQAAESAEQAANDMLETDAAKKYFGTSLDSNQAFIEHIYFNTLGKTYAQDKDGIDFWVAALDAGTSRGEIVASLVAAIAGAEDGPAKQQFLNRVEVSDYTADNVQKSPSDYEVSLSFKSSSNPAGKLNVTDDADSVEVALDAVDNIGTSDGGEEKPAGAVEHDLEVSRDRITGEKDQANIFNADVAQNANGEQVNTLGSGDKLVGGNKVDTLDATLIDGLTVAGSIMDVMPTTSAIENIVINAQSSGVVGAVGTVALNARKMTDVEKIVSKHSDVDLVVKNMTTTGVGSTDKQTVGMEFTANNTASSFGASNMTVLYDQDYLTAGSQVENTLYYEMMNQDKDLATTDLIEFPLGKITFSLNDVVYSLAADINVMMNDITTYAQLADYLNQLVSEQNWPFKDALKFSVGGTFTDPQGKTGQRILLTSTDKNLPITNPKTSISEDAKRGNYFWDADPLAASSSNDPVRINVELQKVGQAADGGALIIGSMNEAAGNVFNGGSTVVSSTREGFDQFDAVVKGGKERNSSLAELASTNNTLRKVTVKTEDERKENFANLTIGNSNTTVVTGLGNNAADSANALKDVQIFDASGFKGDLTLFAGITAETSAKYLQDAARLNLTGDLNLGKELAQFTYNGGTGNDKIDIQIANAALANTFESGALLANTLNTTKNTFKMNVNGGAGNDTIVVGFDAALVAGSKSYGATNITINGGAGNDIIDITNLDNVSADQSNTATFTVAFDGNFGHDKILGFNLGAAAEEVAVTDEEQILNLTGFVAHAGETINITVGDKAYSYTVKATDGGGTGVLNQAAIETLVAEVLTADTTGTYNTNINSTDKYFATYTAATGVLTAAGATSTYVGGVETVKGYEGKDVGTVKVEISTGSETNVNYETVPPLHSATARTDVEGGLLHSPVGDGLDVLDFTSYGVKAIVLGTAYNATTGVVTSTLAQSKANNFNAAGNAIDDANLTKAGSSFLYLEVSAHNANVYNVYLSQTTQDNVALVNGIDFIDTDVVGSQTAIKGNVIGSIELDSAWTNIHDSQFLI